MSNGRLLPGNKKQLAVLLIWVTAGISMVIAGIFALFNHDKTISAISGVLSVLALIAGILTVIVRIFQVRIQGYNRISADFLIWFVAAFLLHNTNILNKLGKIAFIVGGAGILFEGIRSFAAAFASRNEHHWFIPRISFSVLFIILGIIVICNAESIFTNMLVMSVGIFFIVHGFSILSDWLERAKYLYDNDDN